MKPLKTLTLYEMLLDLMKEEEESLQQIRTSQREVSVTSPVSLNPSRKFSSVCLKFYELWLPSERKKKYRTMMNEDQFGSRLMEPHKGFEQEPYVRCLVTHF